MKHITEEFIKKAAYDYVNQNDRPLFDQISAFKAGASFVLEQLKEERIIDLLAKPLNNQLLESMSNWLENNANRFSNTNEEFDLKTGDIILFKNGYDVPMRTKITAFDIESKNAYLYWDCYWFPIDLKTRFINKY